MRSGKISACQRVIPKFLKAWIIVFRDEIKFEFHWATHLSDEQFEWVFTLFSKNMEDM
jgi:hypothetical protein